MILAEIALTIPTGNRWVLYFIKVKMKSPFASSSSAIPQWCCKDKNTNAFQGFFLIEIGWIEIDLNDRNPWRNYVNDNQILVEKNTEKAFFTLDSDGLKCTANRMNTESLVFQNGEAIESECKGERLTEVTSTILFFVYLHSGIFANVPATWCWKVTYVSIQYLSEGFILFKVQNRVGFTISSKRRPWSNLSGWGRLQSRFISSI